MRNEVRSTVERLDRPSAYYHNRVRILAQQSLLPKGLLMFDY